MAGVEDENAARVAVDRACVVAVTLRSDEEDQARYASLQSGITRGVDEDNGR